MKTHAIARIHGVPLLAVLALAIALVAAACSDGSSSASKGLAAVRITSPADGATVGHTFTVRLEPSVPIGEPSTGRHHVHLYYDGNRSSNEADYDKAYDPTFTVTRLGPGRHAIEAVLANADHSVTAAHTQISVNVSEGAPNDQAPSNTAAPG